MFLITSSTIFNLFFFNLYVLTSDKIHFFIFLQICFSENKYKSEVFFCEFKYLDFCSHLYIISNFSYFLKESI